MGSNPEPDHSISITHREGAIAQSDASRIDRASGMNLLEPETGVMWILAEQSVREAGLLLHLGWESREPLAETLSRVGSQS